VHPFHFSIAAPGRFPLKKWSWGIAVFVDLNSEVAKVIGHHQIARASKYMWALAQCRRRAASNYREIVVFGLDSIHNHPCLVVGDATGFRQFSRGQRNWLAVQTADLRLFGPPIVFSPNCRLASSGLATAHSAGLIFWNVLGSVGAEERKACPSCRRGDRRRLCNTDGKRYPMTSGSYS